MKKTNNFKKKIKIIKLKMNRKLEIFLRKERRNIFKKNYINKQSNKLENKKMK